MRLTADCAFCVVNHHWSLIKDEPDEQKKAVFMREVCRVLAENDPRFSAPVPTAKLQALYVEMFSGENPYTDLKRDYNKKLFKMLPALRERLKAAQDQLALAVWMAMAGNYIDFGVLKEVDDRKLMDMLETPDPDALNAQELSNLRAELSRAERLVYATDNCGEIVLDRLLMEVIRAEYPQIHITALVRGGEVLNDATAEDAHLIGLDEVAEIVGNGSNLGGTQLELLGAEGRAAVEGADVLIAKGQGNFETLTGSGLNVYYLFLCKCRLYTRLFGMEYMKGQIVNERRFQSDV